MTIRYAERYSNYYQHSTRPYTEEKARKRHESGQLDTAILEEDGRVVVTVQMCFQKVYCHVDFLDELGRWGSKERGLDLDNVVQDAAHQAAGGDTGSYAPSLRVAPVGIARAERANLPEGAR